MNTKGGLKNGHFNTLAQKGTGGALIIQGEGSTKASIAKRPKKKFITQKLCLALIDVAKENGENNWVKKYWNTWHCQEHITTYNGKGFGYFCKNRFCTICVGIRKADMINKYKPILSKWEDKHFLTLTVKAQPNYNLDKWMYGMLKAFDKIRRLCSKRFERGRGIKLIGIRSLECNFNPVKKTYNPHFHILTASKEIAELIKEEWVQLWTKQFALPFLQDIRPVRNTEKDLIETIKYGAKIFVDPDMKKGNSKAKHKVYAAGLHEIYKAMEGRRLFGSFGFKNPKREVKKSKSQMVINAERWEYVPSITDWVNVETGQVMTKYKPEPLLENLLSDIDTSLI